MNPICSPSSHQSSAREFSPGLGEDYSMRSEPEEVASIRIRSEVVSFKAGPQVVRALEVVVQSEVVVAPASHPFSLHAEERDGDKRLISFSQILHSFPRMLSSFSRGIERASILSSERLLSHGYPSFVLDALPL
ncbi:hypothetical protein SUGI_1373660 [Cryptomeria japonica]|uniref:Uncharacterized protein n=1 Tax=Cryptomeria japonica TaxID=3369 RepID=A0AAD3RQ49_CRYJA|nr:hypothetical protein SUGI_1373660 [Cryptomeria japonica]